MVLKYRHCDGNLCIKVTDNSVVSDTREYFDRAVTINYCDQVKSKSFLWLMNRNIFLCSLHPFVVYQLIFACLELYRVKTSFISNVETNKF